MKMVIEGDKNVKYGILENTKIERASRDKIRERSKNNNKKKRNREVV